MSPVLDSTLKNNGLIAAYYVRVSTGRQENEATKDSQIDEIQRKVAEDGNILSPENCFVDDGWTGEVLERPSMDLMRDAAIRGDFQVLYVYDRGRLARKFAYQEIVIEEIENVGVKFVTLHDVEANTPEEKVLQAMQGVFAEYEKVKIVERFRRGKLFKAKSGRLINGHSLYGYNYIKKTDTVPTHCEINEEEARVVRMIFEWVGIERISLREVIRRLYDQKIMPRRRKNEFWTKGPIKRLLQTDSYVKGVIYFNKSEAIVAKNPTKNIKYKKVKRTSRKVRPKEEWIPFNVPPILIDNGLFEKVQEILATNQKYARKNRKFEYLLTSKIFCECGSPRVGDGVSKNGHHYYRCSERIKRFPKEKICSIPGINAKSLDESLWKELVSFVSNPLSLKKAAEEYLKEETNKDSGLEDERKQIIKEISRIEEEKLRYSKAYGADVLDFEQYQQLIKECKEKAIPYKRRLTENKRNLDQKKVSSIEVEELCEEAKNVLNSLEITNKVQIIKDLVEKVIIKINNEVEVWANITLQPLRLGYELKDRNSRAAKCRQINFI